MRCPNCDLALNEQTDECPWCFARIPQAAEATPAGVAKPRRYDPYKEPFHYWIWLGNLFTIGLGVLCIHYLGTVNWCLWGGILLIALAAISLAVSRLGTRWEDISTVRKAFIWPGVLGGVGVVIGAVVVLLVRLMDGGDVDFGPFGDGGRSRSGDSRQPDRRSDYQTRP